MLKKSTRMGFYLLIAVVAILTIYRSLIPRFDEDKVMEVDQEEFLLSDLTNFKWDYAELFVGWYDFAKIDFYYSGKLILAHGYRVEPETVAPPQLEFTLTLNDEKIQKKKIKEYIGSEDFSSKIIHEIALKRDSSSDIVLYMCEHDAKIRFAYKDKDSNKHYYPVNCKSITKVAYENQLK